MIQVVKPLSIPLLRLVMILWCTGGWFAGYHLVVERARDSLF